MGKIKFILLLAMAIGCVQPETAKSKNISEHINQQTNSKTFGIVLKNSPIYEFSSEGRVQKTNMIMFKTTKCEILVDYGNKFYAIKLMETNNQHNGDILIVPNYCVTKIN
jgi:hypothetical protein